MNDNCVHSSTKFAFYLLFLGQFIKGFGSPTLYTLGTSYIDDGLQKKQAPAFLGILIAFRLLGPALGSLISSLCLHFYEDPFHDPGFDQNDPRWIGAWWLGFIIIGVSVLLIAFPMLLFPRNPKRTEPSPVITQPAPSPVPMIRRLKGFFQRMYRVGKNPILLCYYVGTVFRVNGMMGYFILLPKYMEMQFRQSASEANLYAGPASLVGMQVGSILGGFIISKFKPGPRALTGGVMIVESFSFVALICCMFITCRPYQLSGTTMTLENSLNLWNDCNANCPCTTREFTPVCGPDGISTYFSACFAGCTGLNTTEDDKQVYTNCRCVHSEDGEFAVGASMASYCRSDCQWMVVYIVILTLGKMSASTAIVGNVLITMRCVDKQDKSLALGTVMGVVALLALIPHPLLYGAMTDSSCLVWEESCGMKGNCWIYDTDKLRYLLHGVSGAFVFIGCFCDVLVWILSPRIGNLYEEDDVDKADDENQKSLEMNTLKE